MNALRSIKLLALLLVLTIPILWIIACQSSSTTRTEQAALDDGTGQHHQEQEHAHEQEHGHEHSEEGWNLPAKAAETKNPVGATPESIVRGKELFEANCVVCHGKSGEGDGPMVASLPRKPTDLSDTKMMAQHTDGELFWKITKGKAPMPSYEKMLSETDRWHLYGRHTKIWIDDRSRILVRSTAFRRVLAAHSPAQAGTPNVKLTRPTFPFTSWCARHIVNYLRRLAQS